MKNRLGLTFAVVAAIFLIGCTMSPNYVPPVAPIPAEWPEGEAYRKNTTEPGTFDPTVPGWQEFLTDAKLRQVIGLALTNNLDLRIAAMKVEEARALYNVQRADLLPSIDASGSGSRQRVPADLSITGHRRTSSEYTATLGVMSWEPDVFGRIRSLKDRALQEYLASDQARRNVQILLVSSVAQAYLSLAADQEKLAIAETTLKAQKASYTLISRRLNAGLLATELDLCRAQTQVDTARGDVAAFIQRVAIDRNALTLLAGQTVPEQLLPVRQAEVAPLHDFDTGVSSDTLLSRPDVVQAEDELKACYANIGAARAAFFPRIALTTGAGSASSDLSDLFKGGQGTWSYAPQVTLPVFDARTWSALKVAKTQRNTAVTQYQKTIQGAFREVADTLAVQGTVDKQVSAQESLVNAVSETYRLSNSRYDRGVDSYLSVLDAQRTLYDAQQGLVSLRLAKQTNLVKLYAALGGGVREK